MTPGPEEAIEAVTMPEKGTTSEDVNMPQEVTSSAKPPVFEMLGTFSDEELATETPVDTATVLSESSEEMLTTIVNNEMVPVATADPVIATEETTMKAVESSEESVQKSEATTMPALATADFIDEEMIGGEETSTDLIIKTTASPLFFTLNTNNIGRGAYCARRRKS